MSRATGAVGSFQDRFCTYFNVPGESYGEAVLRLTLYPHARWLATLGPRRLLRIDCGFVAEVGRLTRWRDFAMPAETFKRHAENRLFHRRTLRLRVSVQRMRILFSEVWGEPCAGSRTPPQDEGGASGSLVTDPSGRDRVTDPRLRASAIWSPGRASARDTPAAPLASTAI